MQRHIYVMLSCTNTIMGKLIRVFSHCKYNHISLASSSSLQPLYSFARYNHNSPFVGGFVEESLCRYLFSKKNTKARVYKIAVDEKTFDDFQLIIKKYSDHSSEYIYDTFGVFHGDKITNPYQQTCLSFSVFVLKKLLLLSENTHAKNTKDFEALLSSYPYVDINLLYEDKDSYVWGNDYYYKKIPYIQVIKSTYLHLKKHLLPSA
ncbi:MAG: hypothetical protein IKJ16_01065 [Agathobacter sp.]|nr:hypothetical protein [Agathobacter sp.]